MRKFLTRSTPAPAVRSPRQRIVRRASVPLAVGLLAVLLLQLVLGGTGAAAQTNPSLAASRPLQADQPTGAVEVIATPAAPDIVPTAEITPTTDVDAAPTPADGSEPAAASVDGQAIAAACTPTNLTKGPVLILTGANTSMKLSWQWSTNSTFNLRWGRTTEYLAGNVQVNPANTTYHTYAYSMLGLAPATRYNYLLSVGSQCASGTFYTPPAATATSVKFFAYGDTRTNIGPHDSLAGRVVSHFQSDPAFQTFTINVGDWVNGDTDSAWASEFFNTSYANIRKQDANVAEVGVRGNHEGAATYWTRYFPQPFQGGGLYRSFDYGPVHVAMIDQYVAYNAGSAQYNWLKNDLAASTKKWKVVVLHEPGWSSGGGHENNTTVQRDLQPLFTQYGVSLVFGGHNHYYARAAVNGVQHLTVGGGGAPLYAPASGYPNIVVAKKAYSYGEFTIAGSTLTAKIVDINGATIDSFTLTR